MNLLDKIYLRLSWLSIDVVFGAMAGMLFFSKLLYVQLEWEIYLLLGLAVWSIYTTDHLLDSRKKSEEILATRHHFHLKHKTILSIVLGIAILIGLFLAYIELGLGRELIWSLVLGTLILASMLLVRLSGQSMAWSKEMSIAVFYVMGIAWMPLLRADVADINWKVFFFLISYGLLAWINLLILSHLDRQQDQLSGFFSSALLFPPLRFIQLIRKLTFLLLLAGLAAFVLFPSFYRPFACILVLMALVHYLAFFNPKLSAEQVRIRMEAAFMFPFLLIFL